MSCWPRGSAPRRTDRKARLSRCRGASRKYFSPSPEDLKKEHEQYSGSYFHLVAKRAGVVKEFHSAPFYMSGWDMLTMMLIGIAFIKTGVLAAERSEGFYWRMMLGGYAIGLPIGAASACSPCEFAPQPNRWSPPR